MARKLDKKESNRWLQKIYKIIDSDDWEFHFKKMHKKRGLNDMISIINIHPGCEIVPTVIHECLHTIKPKAPHKWIFAMENKIFNSMSDRQYVNLLIKFCLKLKSEKRCGDEKRK